MGIKPKFSLSDLLNMTKEVEQTLDRMLLRALTRLGEECVREARDRSPEASWIDHTGNLRSSIGYVIVRPGGKLKLGGFEGEESAGANAGASYAKSIAKEYSNSRGYTLILVAGMKYAVYVEALTNKDVLATPELYARRRLPELMQRLAESLKKKTKR